MSNNTQLNKKKYFHQIYRFSKGNNYNNFESVMWHALVLSLRTWYV